MSDVTLSAVDARSAPAQWAMTQYFTELAERFPEGFDAASALDDAADAYNAPRGVFVLALLAAEADPVGCGAVQFLDDEMAEVKRMWVDPRVRGLGLGKRLLAHLENEARRVGCRTVVLDTHGSLTEAIALYERRGFAPIPRYNDNPYAQHWFAKSLTEPDDA